MSRDTAIGRRQRTPVTSHLTDPLVNTTDSVLRVRVSLPPAARALSTLSGIDYEDAFLVGFGPGRDRTAEQWARAVLEDAPLIVRSALLSG